VEEDIPVQLTIRLRPFVIETKDTHLHQIQIEAELLPVQEDQVECHQVNPGNVLLLIIHQDAVPVIARVRHPTDPAAEDHQEVTVQVVDQEVAVVQAAVQEVTAVLAVIGEGDNFYETFFCSL